jgi:hypothetical protein
MPYEDTPKRNYKPVYTLTVDGQFAMSIGKGGKYIKFYVLNRRATTRVITDKEFKKAELFAIVKITRALSILSLISALSAAFNKRPARSRRNAFAAISRVDKDILKLAYDRQKLLDK